MSSRVVSADVCRAPVIRRASVHDGGPGPFDAAAVLRALAAEREALSAEVERLHRRAERAEAALRFYADIAKYPAPLTGGMGALWHDCGQIARAALASTEAPDEQG